MSEVLPLYQKRLKLTAKARETNWELTFQAHRAKDILYGTGYLRG